MTGLDGDGSDDLTHGLHKLRDAYCEGGKGIGGVEHAEGAVDAVVGGEEIDTAAHALLFGELGEDAFRGWRGEVVLTGAC